MDFSNEYESVKNSVINIGIKKNDNWISIGTGTIIKKGDKVLTCMHCIYNNEQMFVKMHDKSIHPVRDIFAPCKGIDVALLDFAKPIGPGVKLGDSSNVKIGQEAFVIGYPNSINAMTLLSANIASFEQSGNNNLIRLDCSVNHGNSGGPLFSTTGEVIGIVNAKHGSLSLFLDQVEKSQSEARMSIGGIDPVLVLKQLIKEMKVNLNLGIGYAIPVNLVKEVV